VVIFTARNTNNYIQNLRTSQGHIFFILQHLRPYSTSSLTLTLNEWGFNLNFSWVSMLFLNSWRVSRHIVRYDSNPPAIQKQHWHSREAQIEPPHIECQCEWAFRIRALAVYGVGFRHHPLVLSSYLPEGTKEYKHGSRTLYQKTCESLSMLADFLLIIFNLASLYVRSCKNYLV
jgi:hypothetical protein